MGEAGADMKSAEAKYDSNKDYIVDAARVMAATGSETPKLQEQKLSTINSHKFDNLKIVFPICSLK